MENTNKKLYKKALEKWGISAQVFMMLEEMSELQKELCKGNRHKPNKENIVDEIADVEIMLEQMKVLFDCEDEVEKQKVTKLLRLKRLLND